MVNTYKLEIMTTQFNFQKHRLSNLILGTKTNVKKPINFIITNFATK